MKKPFILITFLFLMDSSFAGENQFFETVSNEIIESTFKEIDIPLEATGQKLMDRISENRLSASYTLKIRGYNAAVYTNNTTYISLMTTYTVKNFPLGKLDQWNANLGKTATVFTSETGNPIVRTIIVLEGGISKQNLKIQIERFIEASRSFAEFVN